MSFPVPHGPRICLVGQHGQYQQQIFIRLNSNGLGGSTSLDYGIQDAYFCIPPHISGKDMGPVQMKNLRNPKVVELVNTGAYPDLAVSDFSITFSPRQAPGVEGGYFEISYIIYRGSDTTKTRTVQSIVRVMND